MRLSARVGDGARVLWIGALAALSLPGVHAARAEADLVPPVAELFSWKGQPSPSSHGPMSCTASSEASARIREERRQAALARIAALVSAGPGDAGQPLDARGYAYPVARDPYRELRRVELEAQRQRALRAAGTP